MQVIPKFWRNGTTHEEMIQTQSALLLTVRQIGCVGLTYLTTGAHDLDEDRGPCRRCSTEQRHCVIENLLARTSVDCRLVR
jgi:hypothetical protein